MTVSGPTRLARRWLVVGVAAASAAALAVVSQGAAQAAPSPTEYGKLVRACAPAQQGYAACDAVRLVRTTHKTAGAVPLSTAKPAYGVGKAGGYTPADLARAYNLNENRKVHQTIAIIDAFRDPKIRSDLNTFDERYGLPQEAHGSLRVVNQHGGPVTKVKKDRTGWTIEQALDVDAVRGICHTCRILLVETNSDNFKDLGAGVNYAVKHATIVSNSYGGSEKPGPLPGPGLRRAYHHPGRAILASTGDDGWYDWDYFNQGGGSSNSPQLPASFNSVVAVGGTTLDLNPNGTRASESVWNENGRYDVAGRLSGLSLGASGGGCSLFVRARAFQRTVGDYSSLGCGDMRSATDIAALADPYTGYDIYSTYKFTSDPSEQVNGWATFGGTSLATPLVAAMWGLAGGPAGVKYPASTLYAHYKTDRPTYDVRLGANGLCGGSYEPLQCQRGLGIDPNSIGAGQLDCGFNKPGTLVRPRYAQCYARKDYDGPSGVGAPRGLGTFKPK